MLKKQGVDGLKSETLNKKGKGLQHAREFFDADFQVLNDGAKCLTLQFAFMHRDHHACLVALTHINRMAAALAPKDEPQSLGNANQVLCSGRGSFGVTQESQSV